MSKWFEFPIIFKSEEELKMEKYDEESANMLVGEIENVAIDLDEVNAFNPTKEVVNTVGEKEDCTSINMKSGQVWVTTLSYEQVKKIFMENYDI